MNESSNRDVSIGKLIRLAGERDAPSPAATQRARDAAYESWRRSIAAEPAVGEEPRAARRPRWMWVAASMTVLLAAVVAVWSLRSVPPPVQVAQIVTLSAPAQLEAAGRGMARTGTPLYSGSTLITADGSATLLLGDSLSLRMREATRVRFDAPDRVTLLLGSIYVDSGGVNTASKLHVLTPAGEVRHVGTQFQITVNGDSTRVQVREGRVVLTRRHGETHDIAAGDRLEVTGEKVDRVNGQPSFGAAWDWAATAAPVFDMENRPLTEFLSWIAREHGWQVRFANAASQSNAQQIRLHGSLEGLDAAGMLERVSLVTGVPILQESGVLLVGGES